MPENKSQAIWARRNKRKRGCAIVLSHVGLFVTPWTVAHQAPLSMEFSGQGNWRGLTFLLQGSSQSWDWALIFWISCIVKQILYPWTIWDALKERESLNESREGTKPESKETFLKLRENSEGTLQGWKSYPSSCLLPRDQWLILPKNKHWKSTKLKSSAKV